MDTAFYAVLNLDDVTVVSIKTSTREATDTAHTLANHPETPVRNILILPVLRSLYIAWSVGVGLELELQDLGGLIVPVVRVARRRAADPPKESTESLLRAALTPSNN